MVDARFGLVDDTKLLDNLTKREFELKNKQFKKKARLMVNKELRQARKNILALYSAPVSGVLTTACLGTIACFEHHQFLTTAVLAAAGSTVLTIPFVIKPIKEENRKIQTLKEKEQGIYEDLSKDLVNFEKLEQEKKKKKQKK